ncbi:GTPase HflX [Anaerocolumna cellulosilytica]|uniref:GTPase HflX n=1 Tax=Anaerocolumna cellulosilytica TaxID=433286 RepID=A0A6S6QZ33_9FIRM|nr:GTPase HflX [Anaerocolumna cellulosilytica]MBB5195372.1 GTP-binding protein HflX [Anaerocolumna cellulosilytica]BCJ95904.1 GTPase HflX [Anaerocolumna cellulosilytica]
MGEMFEIKEKEERLILVGVAVNDGDDTQESIEELEELAKTAGAVTVAKVIQNRESVHPGTYIGKGKIEEIRDLMTELEATGVICDDELSPAQLKNLEDSLQAKVMDRTILILDIFAQHAVTKEGKIQVELAQLKYRATRLVGMRNSMSRLGGGIGTRGPGEKKLEMDRRLIRDRISQLNRELKEVKQSRITTRELRSKGMIPVIAIVGYTNAGKSTLLNRLTSAGVLEEDKLFATLDPTTRSLTLQNGQQVLFTDTVGFIRKLPHHLIEAFRSTLEEAKYADIILHVVDSSNPSAYKQMHVVYETLANLGVIHTKYATSVTTEKSIITAFNKQDLLETDMIIKDFKADRTVKISAREGTGLNTLQEILEEILRERKILIERVFSYQDAGKIQIIRKYGQLLEEDYQPEGIYIKAYLPKDIYQSLV